MRGHFLWFCPTRQVAAEVNVARTEGAKPGMFYSSAQTANGLWDIAAPNSGLGAVLNQGAPAQQPLHSPRSSVLGGDHSQQVWGSPGQGLPSGPAVPTHARLSQDSKT